MEPNIHKARAQAEQAVLAAGISKSKYTELTVGLQPVTHTLAEVRAAGLDMLQIANTIAIELDEIHIVRDFYSNGMVTETVVELA